MQVSVDQKKRTLAGIRLISQILGPSCSVEEILEILQRQQGDPSGRAPTKSQVS